MIIGSYMAKDSRVGPPSYLTSIYEVYYGDAKFC